MRLLVADDHPGYRLLVRTALADSDDIELVAEVSDVEAVRRAAAELRPDVALLDLLLPGGGGFAAAEALQAVAPGAAAVVSSAHSMEELEGAGDVGIGFLSKGTPPFALPRALGDLVATLHRVEPALDEVSERFPSDATSSGAARHLVTDTLRRWDCEELVESARLLISELVSNAVLHAGSDVEVALHLLSDRVRFEVSDRSANPMRRRQASDDDTSGRGSELIDLLARAWGMAGRADGKCIWFELDR